MQAIRKSKTGLWIMMTAGVLVSFVVICPYICSSAQASIAKAHECCTESSDQHQKQKEESGHCCDQHDHIIFKETSASLSQLHYFQAIALPILSATLVTLDKAIAYHFIEKPPIYSLQQPLYLSKNVLLI